MSHSQTEIVLGPPGTGKTTTLLGMVENALERGVSPDRVAYLSFTRRAADEAITRACAKFNRDRSDFPYFRTLHSLCFRYLGLSNSDVLEGGKLRDFGEYAGVKLTGRYSEDGTLTGFSPGDRILFMENLSRVRGIPLRRLFDEFDDELTWAEVSRVSRALAEFKRELGIMDYTDMLLEFVRQGNRPVIDELYVDEAQDLSNAQWQVVRMLADGCKRVVIAGDDDQAIYRWAGADVDFFVDLPGKVTVLHQSWRVPRMVQDAANGPIGAVTRRRPKEWCPREDAGIVDRRSSFLDSETDGDDVLVLARNDYVLRDQVEPYLRRQGVIYEKHGHPSVKQAVLEAITWWERLRRGESVTGLEARRIYSMMSSGVGVKRGHKNLQNVADEETVDMQFLRESGGLLRGEVWHEALDRVPRDEIRYLLAALRRGEKLRAKPRVRISTIHGSKGGEADHVILMTEIAQRTFREMQQNPDDEARCWYVGATRAKRHLTIVGARTNRRCPWL